MSAMQRSNSKQARSIASHPLFPALVALWSGALFGLGSLAIRPSLIEELVIAARIDLLISAAAPPLGLTARILIALTLTALGAILGAWIGRRLGETRSERGHNRRDARIEEPTAPFTPGHGGTGNGAANQAAQDQTVVAGHRRVLALKEGGRRFEIDEVAPLPGGPPQIFAVAEIGIEPIETTDHLTSLANPLELVECAVPTRPDPDPVALGPAEPPEPAIAVERPAFRPELVTPEVPSARSIQPVDLQIEPVAPALGGRPAPPLPESIDPDAPLTELARRLAEAMQRRRAARSGPPVDLYPASQMPDAFRLPLPVETAPDRGELVLPSLLPPRRDPVAPIEMELPAALRPLVPEDIDVGEELPAALDDLLPPRRLDIPPVESAAVLAADMDEDAEDPIVSNEHQFSSLLHVAPRIEHRGTPFVRIEELPAPAGIVEPVVIFPGQIAGDRPLDPPGAEALAAANAAPARAQDETERALRLALASLQRMSGTA